MAEEYIIHPQIAGCQGVCPHCGHKLKQVLPLEPIFDLPTVAALVPMTQGSLQNWLKKNSHKIGQVLYKSDKRHRIHRYLRTWEAQVVRDHVMKTRNDFGQLVSVYETYANLEEDYEARVAESSRKTSYKSGS